MASKGKTVERCTFCEKSRHHVQSLISGPPGIYICNECIDICNTILKEEDKKQKSGAAGSAGGSSSSMHFSTSQKLALSFSRANGCRPVAAPGAPLRVT